MLTHTPAIALAAEIPLPFVNADIRAEAVDARASNTAVLAAAAILAPRALSTMHAETSAARALGETLLTEVPLPPVRTIGCVRASTARCSLRPVLARSNCTILAVDAYPSVRADGCTAAFFAGVPPAAVGAADHGFATVLEERDDN